MLHRLEDDSPVSPGSNAPAQSNYFSDSPSNSPMDRRMPNTYRDYRRDLAIIDTSNARTPSISRDPPSSITPSADIAPWAIEPSTTSSGAFSRSFFDDTDETIPSLRPDTARTGASDSPDALSYGDDRRPSLVSITTVSSRGSGSRASGGKNSQQKKLAGFFGEDVSGFSSQQSSNTSIPTIGREHSSHSRKSRNSSLQTNNTDGRPISPADSRPRTPLPSSDVVPWVFQDFKVSSGAITFVPRNQGEFAF